MSSTVSFSKLEKRERERRRTETARNQCKNYFVDRCEPGSAERFVSAEEEDTTISCATENFLKKI